MTYQKDDAKMTQGLAIVCMVVLHLFCRQGADVLGTPLLWINESTPFVYWFGFFAEICVPLYSLCMGYAQELLLENGKSSFLSRIKRIGKIMLNYWIVLILFSVIGWIVEPAGNIPGSWLDFTQAIFLLKSYNGAWWFLHTYVFLLLLPPKWLLLPVRKCKPWLCVIVCAILYGVMFIAERYGLLAFEQMHPVLSYVVTELYNMLRILAYVWLGALFCKCHFMDRVKAWWESLVPNSIRKPLLAGVAVLLFIGANILHKAVIMGPIAVLVFLMFNLWQKSRATKAVMLFLGDHSTNIWLVHMFFYAYIFVGLVEYAKWPLLMLGFMFALCIGASYVIKGATWLVNKGVTWIAKVGLQ